jgi:hypothetical protein
MALTNHSENSILQRATIIASIHKLQVPHYLPESTVCTCKAHILKDQLKLFGTPPLYPLAIHPMASTKRSSSLSLV